MIKRTASLAVLPALLVAGSALAVDGTFRPETWAVPVAGTSVTNLYRIEPDLYRCGQPSATGFKELSTLGVKTVLDLRGGHSDDEGARGCSLKLQHIGMRAWGLRDDRVLEALRLLVDHDKRPLVIHCRQGADRTGAIVALYRVVVQGWSKADAIREMNEGGYHHSGLWRNLDRYVQRANVEALRKELGITGPVTAASGPAADPLLTGALR